jgi:hypothetical protein
MFEYKVILIDPTWSDTDGQKNIEQQLNDLGKDGWELIPIMVSSYLFLKRWKGDAKK